jgi:beta-lactamase class A
LNSSIINKLKNVNGKIGFYYKNLITNEEISYNENETFLAASVIKLPILAAIFQEAAKGNIDLSDMITVKHSDKVPSCGALNQFTFEPTVDIRTLCRLMIVISDNTATNVLINHLTIEKLSKEFNEIGLKNTKIKRLLFDSEASKQGKENKFAPKEIGNLLEQIYKRTFINESISKEMEDILLEQQINHKIPGMLPDLKIAHKTGEDDGITHDVGIVYSNKPFIIVFASNETGVPEFEQLIREISYELATVE